MAEEKELNTSVKKLKFDEVEYNLDDLPEEGKNLINGLKTVKAIKNDRWNSFLYIQCFKSLAIKGYVAIANAVNTAVILERMAIPKKNPEI